ncbi:MAG: RNA-guided endonuclease TnpB family protein [Crocosphaera sp.]
MGCAGFSRFVYNFGLGLLSSSWSLDIKMSDFLRIDYIKKVFTNHLKKDANYAWTNKYSSRIYQHAFMNLKSAFKRWRDGSLKAEIPQFKKKRHQCSFTVDSSNGKVLVKAGKSIKIPTLATFRLKEAIPYNCISQTFTISREAGRWYVSFMVNACPYREMNHTEKVVGVDLGVKTFATLSDGRTIGAPSYYKTAKTKLSKLQWRNRNKVLGIRRQGIKASNNAQKYYDKLRRKYQKVANVREDFLQKETTKLAKTYQEVKIEDLNIKGMLANHKLADAISSLGFYRFRELLTYKQHWYGSLLTVVDRWFPSSKTCSSCGHIQPMPLKQRTYACGGCGLTIDRDLNAAMNLERWVKYSADG